MENMNDVLGKITEFMRSELKTETLIGQQFTLGEFTCVPVISVGLGFGGGGGEGKSNDKGAGSGNSAGGGMGISPVGFLVTKGSDIQFISTKSHGLNSLFEKAPELIEKMMDKKAAEKA